MTALAGIAGLGFAVMLVAVNPVLLRAGLPLPGSTRPLAEISDSLACAASRIRAPSVIVPLAWLCTTVFAGGLVATLWGDDPGTNTLALIGFAAFLMQSAVFAVVEALRFGLVSAATRAPGSVAGLWTMANVLGGFNRVFLTLALVGFGAAGERTGLIPGWHAWLGHLCAALLLALAMLTPYSLGGDRHPTARRIDSLGWLAGGLAWITWIVAFSVQLLAH
ncbi:hypothetical protein BLA60_33580 [Actinophytocola xinjiangensis]|uniref:Uncharacterized protein n=1 Tax=Actinophytocola xinjiangensis TaxID=485602 RepID=A0A7Z0WGW7_9PSEU|nr:hypothetical protein [Actinophytocola xinjiangensis]OLF05988.1 hypothetical protein BLA60_33580 [Actinophytocola xinjiangensis]